MNIYEKTALVHHSKNDEYFLGMLGFATRTRRIIVGKDNLRSYIRNRQKKIKLLILANDVSENIMQDWLKRCEFFGVNVVILDGTTKKDLANRAGKRYLSALGIDDEDMVKGILDKIDKGE